MTHLVIIGANLLDKPTFRTSLVQQLMGYPKFHPPKFVGGNGSVVNTNLIQQVVQCLTPLKGPIVCLVVLGEVDACLDAPEQVATHFKRLVNEIFLLRPQSYVVISGLIPPNSQREKDKCSKCDENIRQMVNKYTIRKITFIKVAQSLNDRLNYNHSFQLSPLGAAKVATKLVAALKCVPNHF